MNAAPQILFPDDIARTAKELVGGKAWGLAQLTAAGAPVPPWCVINNGFFEEHVTGATDSSDIDGLLMQLGKIEQPSGQVASIEPIAKQLRDAILKRPVSTRARNEISAAMQRLGDENSYFAVRSSMVGEDSSHFSFAGQLESLLFQRSLDDVLDSVRQCWASAFLDRVLLYRKRAGLPMSNIQMGVVLQTMVEGQVSGVLFTAHPVTGRRDQTLITAAWGLGEGVVNGLCNADEFVWQHDGHELTAKIADKDVMIVPHRGGRGTVTESVDPSLRMERCLTPAQVDELGMVSQRLAERFGSAQDIEWTWNDAGLHILQARPVTALVDPEEDEGPSIVFDNSNIQESYCGVTTPLTFSFASNAYANVYSQMMRALGLPEKTIKGNQSLLQNLLALVGGRIYYNLNNWYRGLCLLPSFGRNKQDMEAMMGVEEPVDFVFDDVVSLAEKLRRFPILMWTAINLKLKFISLDREVVAFLSRFETISKGMARDRFASATMSRLMQHLVFLKEQLLGHWQTPIVNDFYVMYSVGQLRQLVRNSGVNDDNAVVNDLLTGEDNIASTEPTYALMNIAQRISANATLKEQFAQANPDQALALLARKEPKIYAAVEEYIARFGDRTMGELKLETISLREDPSFLVKVVQCYLQMSDLDTEQIRGQKKIRRSEAEEMLRSNLKPWQRVRIAAILHRARSSIKHRESMRLARTVMFGLFREVYNAIGARLHEAGKLNAPRDIFYLTEEEITAYYEGRSVTTRLAELAELRKNEFSQYELLEIPHRFETRGAVYLQDVAVAAGKPAENKDSSVLQGTGCYPGIVRGALRIILNPNDNLDICGRILTTMRTDPGWAPLFPSALGILVERGSTLSHSAVVARELGIPAVVGVPGLLSIVEDGESVTLNGGTGEVKRHLRSENHSV